MRKYITVSQEIEITEDVDIEVNLEEYMDEIVEFIKDNKKIQNKIKNLDTSYFQEVEKFYFNKELKNEFSLTEKQLKAHLEYRSTDGNRENICNHYLLIKDNIIEGIFTTNGHILIISANDIDDCLKKISEYDLKLFNFQLIQQSPNLTLSIVDDKIYSHFAFKAEKVSTQLSLKEGEPIQLIKVIDSSVLLEEFKDNKSIKVEQFDAGMGYDTLKFKDGKISFVFNSHYFKAIELLSDNYKYISTTKYKPVSFKDKNNFIMLMPIRND